MRLELGKRQREASTSIPGKVYSATGTRKPSAVRGPAATGTNAPPKPSAKLTPEPPTASVKKHQHLPGYGVEE